MQEEVPVSGPGNPEGWDQGVLLPNPGRMELFDYRFEQPGEILFEAMFEFRRKLFGYFDGAFFIDAGNTWTFAVDPSREGTDFKVNRSIKNWPLEPGLGLRMDFDFLVLRLDMGIKAYDPARPEKERFILDNISSQTTSLEKKVSKYSILGSAIPFNFIDSNQEWKKSTKKLSKKNSKPFRTISVESWKMKMDREGL